MAALTFFLKGFLDNFLPEPLGSDDLVFREVVVKAWNELLHRLEVGHDRLSGEDLEVVGNALRRTWIIAQAYKAERASDVRRETLSEWIKKIVTVAQAAGISVPDLGSTPS